MKLFYCSLLIIVFSGGLILAQNPVLPEKIPVLLNAGNLGSKEIEIIFQNSEAYLPALETFNFIGIKNELETPSKRLEGVFKKRDNKYVIDPALGSASIGGRSQALTTREFILRDTTIYLGVGFMNSFFGLDMSYNERRLTVEIRKIKELPAFSYIENARRIERLTRQQLSIPTPEVYLGHVPSVLGGGRIDYSASSIFTSSDFISARYNVQMGAQMLGGDLSARLAGYNRAHYSKNDLHGQFRIPFYGNTGLTQVVGGDLFMDAVQPRIITGVEITNRPLAARYNFSRETFRGEFEPNANIEILGTVTQSRFLKSNLEGLYQFDIPTYYGQGVMEVHAYDPWGLEQVLRYRMLVPRTLIPPGEFEYVISAGRTGRPTFRFTSMNSLAWGVASQLTVGGKLEYYDLDGVNQKIYAAVNATTRLAWNLVFSGSVAPGALSQASLSWMDISAAEFALTGYHYDHNDFFNPARIANRLLGSVKIPLDLDTYYHLVMDVSGIQTEFQEFRTRELQTALTSMISLFSIRLSSLLQWTDNYGTNTSKTAHLTRASMSVYMPAGVILQAETDYSHLLSRFESFRLVFLKRFPNSLELSFSYLRTVAQDYYNIVVGLSYYFPFSRALLSASTTGSGRFDYNAALSGSYGFDATSGASYFQNRPSYSGYGGFVVNPFYDANNNGIADKGEERIQKGRVYYSNVTRGGKPSALRYDQLTVDRLPYYEEYDFYLDPQSLDNPVWVPKYTSIRMLSEPNDIKRIDIPVLSGATIHGMVKIATGTPRPAEGITVLIKSVTEGDKKSFKYSKKASTFSTGEYEFSAVPPGRYQIMLDDAQLKTLGYTAQPASRDVEVVFKPEGDLIEKIDFSLTGQ